MSEGRVIVGRYKIEGQLGQGGMGTVYKALDLETDETVAIKSLNRDLQLLSPEMLERFEREGEALRRLDHPNIVKVFGTVEENDEHFIIMEHVSGGSLRDRIERDGALPIKEVLEITLDLCDALTRAHRLNIIHRDIKPANVLIAEDGTPRLTDFGVARIGDSSAVTQTGAIVGTLAYLSPEACSGEKLDPRADIWAMGIMIYEMVTGSRPFEMDSTAALLLCILTEPVPDILQLRPDVPYPLVGLIYWMLEKDRDSRISSIRLVGAQVEGLLTGSDSPLEAFIEGSATHLQTPTPSDAPAPIMQTGLKEDLPAEPGAAEPDATPEKPIWQITTRRKLDRMPRLFISYRRDDSAAVTGRIYDRLIAAFGEDNVFKDVESIPAGADFKETLEKKVVACDVQLVIIGKEWTRVTNEQDLIRLHDPEDFVRIEVASGLNQPDVLVIPVLVNGASMPEKDALPPELQALIYRNAAPVRNDPDFNRDIQWLVNQIENSFILPEAARPATVDTRPRLQTMTPAPASPPRRFPIGLLGIAAILVLAIAGLLLASSGVLTPADPTPTPIPALDLPPPGQVRILVAEIDSIGPTSRDITALIIEDLERELENDVPYSNIIIDRYPAVVTSEDEARTIAEDNHAALIVWGKDDGSLTDLEIQTGSLSIYGDVVIDRETIDEVATVFVRLTDRQQTIMPVILNALNLIYFGAGEVWGSSRNYAILNAAAFDPAEIVGNSAAAHVHRYLIDLPNDWDSARDDINAAIELAPANPILYASRAFAYQRAGDYARGRQDLNTAMTLGGEDWATPYMIRASGYLFEVDLAVHLIGDLDQTLDDLTRAIELRPDDWFAYYWRAFIYTLNADYAAAYADIEKGLSLNPDENYIQMVGAIVSMRTGAFSDLYGYVSVFAEDPDPAAALRVIDAIFGGGSESNGAITYSAINNYLLGQYNQVIDTVSPKADDLIAAGLYEVPLMMGLAQCNLGDYEAAEATYTRVIEATPDYMLPYSLRAEVRLRQGNIFGANQDGGVLLGGPQADVYSPLIPLVLSGDLSCENLLTTDYAAIYAEAGIEPVDVASLPTGTPSPQFSPTPTPTPTATVTETPASTATPTSIDVEPVAEDEVMVLVAEFEHLGGDVRDVQRGIVNDLTQHFEDEVPFSIIRIRSLPSVITSESGALAAAETTGALVIIWGFYDDIGVTVQVQLGSLLAYPDLPFSRDEITTVINIEIDLTNERRESLVYPVVGILNGLYSYTGNSFELARNVALLEQLTVTSPEITGSSLAAYFHRYLMYYIDDPEQALAEIDAAQRSYAGNPIVYLIRALIKQRLGQTNPAIQDIETAIRLSETDWISALFMLANDAIFFQGDMTAATGYLDEIIALKPDDWFAWGLRGMAHYLLADYDQARIDLEQSLELGARSNFPYLFLIMIALRDGDISEALDLFDTVLREFPDPTFSERILAATLNEQAASQFFIPVMAAMGNLTLGQWDDVITETSKPLNAGIELSEIYFLQGFAYCNLEDYDSAVMAYTRAIELDPDFVFLYGLRADAYQSLGNISGMMRDGLAIAQSDQADSFAPLVTAVTAGEVSCSNFLDVAPAVLTGN